MDGHHCPVQPARPHQRVPKAFRRELNHFNFCRAQQRIDDRLARVMNIAFGRLRHHVGFPFDWCRRAQPNGDNQ
jgi:hypothetical protein